MRFSWKTFAWFYPRNWYFECDVCRGNFGEPFSICSLRYAIFVAAAKATIAKPVYWTLTARKQLTYFQGIIYFYFEALQALAECENIIRAHTHTYTHDWNLLKFLLAGDHLFSKHLFTTRKVFSLLIKLKIQYLPAKKQERKCKISFWIPSRKTTTTAWRRTISILSLHSVYVPLKIC